MINLRAHVDDNGRILIPAQIRKEFGIKPGDVFVSRIIDGEIHLISLKKAVENAQSIIMQHIPDNVSLVEELFKSRRIEASKE